jgi:hypothetical protein
MRQPEVVHLAAEAQLLRCVSCSERTSAARALTPNIVSYEPSTSGHNSACKSLTPIRQALTETALRDPVLRGTADNRDLAGTTAPLGPGAAAAAAPAGSPDQFEW